MESSTDLWKRVDELRGRMSIRELSEKTGISEGTLQTTRVMKQVPKLSMLYPIAQALGTNVDYLYTGREITDSYDTPLFRKLSSSQDLIDICTALVDADKIEIEMVKRILRIENPTPPVQQELF